MSNSVDNRVVSMEFDNTQFERNVSQSLETLKHLDESLDGLINSSKRFDGVSFEDVANQISSLANRFTLGGRIIQKVFDDIAEGIVNVAHKMTNFSTQNITAGWDKYAEKTTSVQTIMSATGESIEYVTEQLGRLNRFTDETSYNFADMTSNIAKFTSQGIDLDTSVTQMQGIATWAASAGQNAQAASRAMYNISQAMGAGSMKLIDWKSIQNANMATKEFKEQAIAAGIAAKTLVEQEGKIVTAEGNIEVSTKNFEQTLQKGWFNTEAMQSVFTKYGEFADTIDSIYESFGEEFTVSELIQWSEELEAVGDDADAASEFQKKLASEIENSGYEVKDLLPELQKLNSEELKFSKATYKAAQEAKTFGDAIDATKDAVSTAWMNVFETVFGNYEQQRHLWTDMANWLYDIFAEPVNTLKGTLSDVMNKSSAVQKVSSKLNRSVQDILSASGVKADSYDGIMTTVLKKSGLLTDEMIEGAGSVDKALGLITGDAKDLTKAIDELLGTNKEGTIDATKALTDYRKVASEILRGDWGNGTERKNALEEAGFDYTTAQYFTEMLHTGIGTTEKDLWRLGETASNLTEEQRNALIKIREEIEKGNTSVEEITETIAELEKYGELVEWSGRDLLFGREEDRRGALYDMMDIIDTVKAAISDAWGEIFGGDKVQAIRNVLMSIKQFTQGLKDSIGEGEQIKRTFRGIFAVLDIGKTALSAVWKGFGEIAKLFVPTNVGLGETIAKFGDWLVNIRDWLKTNKVFESAMTKVIGVFKTFRVSLDPVITRVKGLWKSFKDSKGVENTSSFISNVFTSAVRIATSVAQKFSSALDKIVESAVDFYNTHLDKYVQQVAAFFEKLASGGKTIIDVFASIKDAVVDFFTILWNFIKNRDFEQFTKDLNDRFGGLAETVNGFGEKLLNGLQWLFNLDKGTVLTILKLTAALIPFIGVLKLLKRLTSFQSAVVGFLDSVAGSFKSWARSYKANTIVKIAASIAILAAAMYGISKIPADDLKRAKDALLGIMAMLLALTVVVALAGKFANPQAMMGIGLSIAAFAVGIAAAVAAIWILTTKVNYDKIWQALGTLFAIMAMTAAAVIAISKFAGKAALSGAGVLVFAGSILLMVYVLEKIQNGSTSLTPEAFGKLIEIIAILLIASQVLKGVRFSSALGILLFVASLGLIQKMLYNFLENSIPFAKFEKHIKDFIGMITMLLGIALVSRVAGKGGIKMALALVSVIAAIYVLAKVAASIGELPLAQLAKGTLVILALGALIAGIMWVMQTDALIGGVKKSFATSIIALVVAIIALGIELIVLSAIPWKNLLPAVLAVAIVLGGLAFVLKAVGEMSKSFKPKDLLSIVEIVAIIGSVFAALLYLSNRSDPKNVVAAAVALSLTMIALAKAMNMISSIDFGSVNFKDIGNMALEMAAFLGTTVIALAILNTIQGDPVQLIEKVVSLGLLMLALAASMRIISSIDFGGMKLGELGAMFGEMVIVLGLALAGLYGLSMIPIDGSTILTKVAALSAVMLSLSGVAVILSFIRGFDFLSALGAITVAIIGLGELALLCAGFGALDSQFEGFGEAVITGAQILGEAIGKFVGAIGGGILSGATEALFDLDTFAEDIGKVAENLKKIDDSAIAGAGALAKLLLAFGGAELMDGIGNLLGGWISKLTGNDLGTNLVKLATAIKDYTVALSDVNPADINKVSKITNSVSSLFSAVGKEGGLFSLIAGNKSTGLENLSGQLTTFGKAIADMAGAIKGIDSGALDDLDVVSQMTDKLVAITDKVGASGGLVQAVTGEANIAKLGTQILLFVRSLVGGEFGGQSQEGILELASKLNGKDLSGLDTLGTITEKLSTAVSSIPDVGGYVDKIFGSNDPSVFVKEITDYIKGLEDIGIAAAGITESTIQAIQNAASAAEALQLFNTAAGNLIDMPTEQAGEMPEVAKGVNEFSSELDGVDTAAAAEKSSDIVNIFGNLASLGENGEVPSFDLTGLTEGLSGLPELASSSVSGMLKSFTDGASGFKTAGSDMLTNFLSGLTGGEGGASAESIKTAVEPLLSGVLTEFNNSATDATTAGQNYGQGFADGILAKKQAVIAAANALATAATREIVITIDAHSPARVPRKFGGFFGLGFALGIKDEMSTVEKTSETMATVASNAIENAQYLIDDILNSDGQPTITPVLDLSEVRKEAQSLGSLGTMSASVSASRANAISGLRQSIELDKNQNGSSTSNNSYSNVINIYATPNQSVNEIADAVERRMVLKQKQRTVAFAR